MLLCGVVFCCYVPIRYVVLRVVFRWVALCCVVMCGWVALSCVALCCVLLCCAVRCCVMVTAPSTRNVYANGKLSMLSVYGVEWVTILLFRLVNEDELHSEGIVGGELFIGVELSCECL